MEESKVQKNLIYTDYDTIEKYQEHINKDYIRRLLNNFNKKYSNKIFIEAFMKQICDVEEYCSYHREEWPIYGEDNVFDRHVSELVRLPSNDIPSVKSFNLANLMDLDELVDFIYNKGYIKQFSQFMGFNKITY